MEGEDRPTERWKLEFKADYGATGGMMMRKEEPLFGTGKSLVTGSGFYVLKGIVGMLAHGVYGTTVIKKKRYWPKYCKGYGIEAFFRYKEVGDVYAVCGDLDGHKYKIHCTKEADYVMKLFSTHGSLSKRCRETSRTYKDRGKMITKRFCYPEPMDINFLYRP